MPRAFARKSGFGVFFDGKYLGALEVETLEECMGALELDPCTVEVVVECAYRDVKAHGHMTAKHFIDPTPVRRGDRDYWIAALPGFGEVSYNFQVGRPAPPAVIFEGGPCVTPVPSA